MIFTSTICPSLEIGLRILGVWPNISYPTFRRFIFISCVLVVYYLQYLYLLNCKIINLQVIADSLAQILYYTLTTIKVTILWTNSRVFYDILTTMNTDWRECFKVDKHLQEMKIKANNSQFCTNVLLSFNIVAGGVYFGSDNAIAIVHFLKGDNDTSRPFPMKVLLPSQAQQSPLYELLVVLLFLQALSVVYTVAIMNSLISTLILHISGQIDIIHQELRTIFVNTSYKGSIESTTGMLVEKHNKVITLSENIDRLFSYIALLQVFTNTLLICYLGLIAIESLRGESNVGLLKTIFAYPGISAEVFIFCFAGEYLSLKSKSLADAAYASLWYNTSSIHSKKILFVIMRSQKELTITAGGMVNLSLETFASIMKASASYISVLYAMM